MRIIRAGRFASNPRDLPVRATEHDSDGEPLLEIVGLSCMRGDRLLFEGLSVRVSAGQVVQVHGPNGSGKTTL